MNYRDYLQKLIYGGIDPLIHGMIHLGITPNIITFLGFLGNIFATALFISSVQYKINYTTIGWGGFVILVAGLFDMMDGRLARTSNKTSSFGALWDSTLDRYSELVTLFGIVLIFASTTAEWFWCTIVSFTAMVGSVMVSYVRARAEGLGIECKVGFMQRPERVVVTAITAIISGCTNNLWWLAGGMITIAFLANLTAFWRIWHCYHELKRKDSNISSSN
ncbi:MULTISPECIES: CDP-alcohol phosphatidyltransferase family protein [Segatella]|jgi:CDP-diacylglycerol--glycerol-3-phosphate 3-phosphatidyltransferase|uniref:CDP-diacylglycerol-inositol 3-phosphatidyltransferase n=2 Tax=Segatella TaxID=2974251 RepID=D8DTA0_9BACT|nr:MULTISPECIES: CDP-alcohol phosphatidyltransferase family protein [Segatella]MEE3414647.1 CDP-alcohol phosphatidyltransferase family protein [Prevotella sp.]EFI73331.1 CDP-diacylglycerol-inositol 3-phosphatidyltransferase [Segatella baroniae B14]UKK78163.1 CDP-alcohol phosphatidyltransferase family protein [Segatella baroniae B14]SEP65546.1 CDP-diacylglycerol--glycerol-3-phosphate 3-phosphatidyltransferase [Segatella baroniae B14]GJG27547.1 CDP-diacylglycerol--inositol 3-phosphatidyltransfer